MTFRQPIPPSKRLAVLDRDRYTCQCCGKPAHRMQVEVDHVIPVSAGGSNDISNLATACRECNTGKRNRRLPETEFCWSIWLAVSKLPWYGETAAARRSIFHWIDTRRTDTYDVCRLFFLSGDTDILVDFTATADFPTWEIWHAATLKMALWCIEGRGHVRHEDDQAGDALFNTWWNAKHTAPTSGGA